MMDGTRDNELRRAIKKAIKDMKGEDKEEGINSSRDIFVDCFKKVKKNRSGKEKKKRLNLKSSERKQIM